MEFLDKDDKCPEVKVLLQIKVALSIRSGYDEMNEYSRTILFDSGKASFKETYPTLLSITEILKNILIQDF
jgi:hypothetical protein